MRRIPFNIKFYKKKISNITKLNYLEIFQNELVKTNRTYNFFVDWKKVKQNADELKVELNLLNALINSKNLNIELEGMLIKYPEIVKTFPILIAIRVNRFPVIEDFSSSAITIKEYHFNIARGTTLNKKQIQDYIAFINKTGANQLFYLLKDFYNYVLGIEVGMDTHARKNRSGTAMENLIEPMVTGVCQKYNIHVYSQRSFNSVGKEFGITMPPQLLKRRCDFILVKEDKFCNVEVNYYAGGGSKPEEIVDSYIQRYNEIKKNNGYFIWITDGNVWNISSSQINKGFNNLPYLLNLSFVRKGLLEEAIKEIFL